MPSPTESTVAAWAIAAAVTAAVMARPFRLPEAVWATAGACILVAFGLLPWTAALSGIGKGLDVYLFLAGMMVIAELARQEGLFDWLAALAVAQARGSPARLFGLVYAVGTGVTIFLSNDATAVVLTPAVFAATRAAGARPLPYLFACAFVANAASFVLPISNPANLVVFGTHMPHLRAWLMLLGVPSLIAIIATYLALRFTQRQALLRDRITRTIPRPHLGFGGRLTACGIGAIATVLLCCSALDLRLGLPTFICGAATALVVLAANREWPWPLLTSVPWGVLPLVAGLFVIVEALARTGVLAVLSSALPASDAMSTTAAAEGAGVLAALTSNVMNNLPVALIAGSVVAANHLPEPLAGALLIGVDLGPNLSATGSLATILWLVALRREGIEVGAGSFLRLGLCVMPPALLLALAALRLSSGTPL